ncbi:hypothetical protein JCM10908_004483 [Rhodotorula pacifica]|uniref:uncharacterized protein n=1 Tax=Rhodotorula pacifica TaxID=1495444 RepID=UPI00316BF407
MSDRPAPLLSTTKQRGSSSGRLRSTARDRGDVSKLDLTDVNAIKREINKLLPQIPPEDCAELIAWIEASLRPEKKRKLAGTNSAHNGEDPVAGGSSLGGSSNRSPDIDQEEGRYHQDGELGRTSDSPLPPLAIKNESESDEDPNHVITPLINADSPMSVDSSFENGLGGHEEGFHFDRDNQLEAIAYDNGSEQHVHARSRSHDDFERYVDEHTPSPHPTNNNGPQTFGAPLAAGNALSGPGSISLASEDGVGDASAHAASGTTRDGESDRLLEPSAAAPKPVVAVHPEVPHSSLELARRLVEADKDLKAAKEEEQAAERAVTTGLERLARATAARLKAESSARLLLRGRNEALSALEAHPLPPLAIFEALERREQAGRDHECGRCGHSAPPASLDGQTTSSGSNGGGRTETTTMALRTTSNTQVQVDHAQPKGAATERPVFPSLLSRLGPGLSTQVKGNRTQIKGAATRKPDTSSLLRRVG